MRTSVEVDRYVLLCAQPNLTNPLVPTPISVATHLLGTLILYTCVLLRYLIPHKSTKKKKVLN